MTPEWVKERIEADEAMGGTFEGSQGERFGFMLGTVIRVVWALFWWGIALAMIAALLYIVGRALVGS